MNASELLEKAKYRSICNYCGNAVANGREGCTWSREGKPVEGWTAVWDTRNGTETWKVLMCPQYKTEHEGREITDEGLKRMAAEICLRAVKDYRIVCRQARRGRRSNMRGELEHFFVSDHWAVEVMELDGQSIIETIKEEYGIA